MRCLNCGHDTPIAPFCVRCGEPLENPASPYPLEQRGYAAAPQERWFVPRIVSSLFPHLPRADMEGFHVALIVGAGAIVVLCAFDLFPLALVVAATLVPLLTLLYILDVDLYEDEPAPALALTIGWGIAAGIVLGLATRHVTPEVQLGGPTRHDAIWLGVVVPLAGLVLMLAGPLLLLPYRRFNDVLDGATFGITTAVFAAGAEVVTNSRTFLRTGVTSGGDSALWVARLLTLGIALPVLSGAVVGCAAAAFWLRYRTPIRDRGRLGPFGSPAVAVAAAAAALVAANLAQLYLGVWTSLAATSLLAAGALVLLRRSIHIGLIEEAGEQAIGDPIACPSCHRETPIARFCAQCGVSLQALPKRGRRIAGAPSVATSKVRWPVVAAAFAALVAAGVGLAAVVIVVTRPGPVEPICESGRPCGAPPVAEGASTFAAASYTTWRSKHGPRLTYNPRIWGVKTKDDDTLVLEATLTTKGNPFVQAALYVMPASTPPEQALLARIGAESEQYNGLAHDLTADNAILGAVIGFVPAIAETYYGASKAPPSPGRETQLVFEAAAAHGATVVLEAATDAHPVSSSSLSSPYPLGVVDELLDRFRWQS